MIRLDGFLGKKKSGLNYVFSYGNGYSAYDVSGYQAVDNNNNKTLTGRISIFPYFQNKLNIGLSYANGAISNGDQLADDTLVNHYASNFESIGADLTIDSFKNLKFRSYLILTKRSYYSYNKSITNNLYGYMVELSYTIDVVKMENIKSIIPKIRYDLGHVESFNGISTSNNEFNSIYVKLSKTNVIAQYRLMNS